MTSMQSARSPHGNGLTSELIPYFSDAPRAPEPPLPSYSDTHDSPLVGSLAHEGKMLLLATALIGLQEPSTAPRFTGYLNERLGRQAISHPKVLKHWAEVGLVPVGLLEMDRRGDGYDYFRAAPTSLDAMPLIGFYDELGEQSGHSMVSFFGSPSNKPGRSNPIDVRLSILRYVYDNVVAGRVMTTHELTSRAGYSRLNVAKDVLGRLMNQGLLTVERWDPSSGTLYAPGERMSHDSRFSSELRNLIADLFTAEADLEPVKLTRVQIEEHLLANNEELASLDARGQKRRITGVLHNMFVEGYLDILEGRRGDGELEVTFDKDQLETVGRFLEGLHRYSLRDPVFIKDYGQRAIDLAQSDDMMSAAYKRLCGGSNRVLKARKRDVQDSVLAVLQSLEPGDTLTAQGIAAAIASRARVRGDGWIPPSVAHLRAVLRGLVADPSQGVSRTEASPIGYSLTQADRVSTY